MFDYVYWNLADRLCGIRVENDALFVTKFSNFRNRLQHTNLIVRSHDGDQDCLVIDRALQIVEVNQTIFLHRQIGHAIAVLFEALAGVEHSFVLGDGRDDVIALLAIHFGNTFDREIVAFGGARGEDNLFRGGADQFGNPLARSFNRLFAGPSK